MASVNSIPEVKKEILNAISKKTFPNERFLITTLEGYGYVLRITLKETWNSFFVSLDTSNHPLKFNYGYLPYTEGQSYRLTSGNWEQVLSDFDKWLDSIKKHLFTRARVFKLEKLQVKQVQLEADERNFLSHWYREFLRNTDTQPIYQVTERFYPKASSEFSFDKALKKLKITKLLSDNNTITPYGIWHVDPNAEILDLLDEVIKLIRHKILTEPGIRTLATHELVFLFEIDETKVQLVFRQLNINGFANHINHQSHNGEINIEGPNVYRRYGQYKDLGILIQEFAIQLENSSESQNSDSLAVDAKMTQETKEILGPQNINIRDLYEVEPVLRVKELAREVTGVIKNFKLELGSMIGVFGPWGRGKTFFMNQTWQLLQEDTNTKYIRIDYHSWRYQDTPASWAYLYERFSERYLGDKKGVGNTFRYYRRLWSLNVEREGVWNLISAWLLITLSLLSSLFIPAVRETIKPLIGMVIYPAFSFLLYFLYKNFKLDHFTKAINLIKKYNLKPTFRENLGIQAEIQKEFVHLINAWIPHRGIGINQEYRYSFLPIWLPIQYSDKSPLNRIVEKLKRIERFFPAWRPKKNKKPATLTLFIDDLDRCKEEKTIEIIDSLRIILDDEEIKGKLLVITAIDERVLQHAIKSKYHALVNGKLDGLIREYMDKLFIFSLRLGPLSHRESEEYFEALVKNDLEKVDEATVSNQSHNMEVSVSHLDSKAINDDKGTTKENIENASKPTVSEMLTVAERNLIKKSLSHVIHPTPRKIRILYYRYLFAKNMIIHNYSNLTENHYWLQDPNHEHFINALIYFSQESIPSSIIDEKSRANSEKTDEIGINFFSNSKAKKSQYLDLLNVLDVVVAY